MTEEEIDKMEAGPELDALVAERVMGWKCELHRLGHGYMWVWTGEESVWKERAPRFSSLVAAAWEVVEKMTTTTKQWFRFEQHSTGAQATFELSGDGDNDFECTAEAMTAPLAICRAALKASLRKAVQT